MAKRVLVTLAAMIVGWGVGVYAYLGILLLVGDGPEPGDIHIGAFALGLVGMVAAGIGGWLWSERFATR